MIDWLIVFVCVILQERIRNATDMAFRSLTVGIAMMMTMMMSIAMMASIVMMNVNGVNMVVHVDGAMMNMKVEHGNEVSRVAEEEIEVNHVAEEEIEVNHGRRQIEVRLETAQGIIEISLVDDHNGSISLVDDHQDRNESRERRHAQNELQERFNARRPSDDCEARLVENINGTISTVTFMFDAVCCMWFEQRKIWQTTWRLSEGMRPIEYVFTLRWFISLIAATVFNIFITEAVERG